MRDVILLLVLIPAAISSIQFWIEAARWLVKHKETLGYRLERIKSAFADDGVEE